MQEYELRSSEIIETCKVEDFSVEGPRWAEFSSDVEYRCMPIYSFKNQEAQMWIHHHDVLIESNGLPSAYLSDVRKGCSVCISAILTPIGAYMVFNF